MFEKAYAQVDKIAGAWLQWRTDRAAQDLPDEWKIKLEKAEWGKDGFTLTGVSEGIVYLANQAAEILDRAGAKNYIQFDMLPRIDKGIKPIRVTIQWANGLSPAEKAAKLEIEIERLNKIIENCGAA